MTIRTLVASFVMATICIAAEAAVYHSPLGKMPTLHTQAGQFVLTLQGPIPSKVNIKLVCMDKRVWQHEVATEGKSNIDVKLTPQDFTCVENPAKADAPLLFYQVDEVFATPIGSDEKGVKEISVTCSS